MEGCVRLYGVEEGYDGNLNDVREGTAEVWGYLGRRDIRREASREANPRIEAVQTVTMPL